MAVRAAPVRFVLEPGANTIFTVESYPPVSPTCPSRAPKPVRAKYRGRLEFLRASNGTVSVIERTTFPRYLEGLAEVPASWPDEALRAQAIAGRSYAIYSLHHPPHAARTLGYDICASDQCQVYRGAAVALGAFGEHWVAAAHDTAGEVLTYGGHVIQAFYFSTSDGHTRSSFPGGTPQPWLPSVAGEDSDAPLSRWTQRIPRARLDAILRAAGNVKLASLSKSALRAIMNTRANCLFPSEFPGALPQTLPSEEFTTVWKGPVLVVSGRGWGHNVGMSQWGAHSLASRGSTAPQILSHYYGPARITHLAEPGTIRVLAIEGMTRVLVSADGPFTVTTSAGGTLAPGDRFEIDGGKELSVLRGRGPSLKPVLSVVAKVDTLRADPGTTIDVPFTISGAARITASITTPTGTASVTAEQSFIKGDGTFPVPLKDSAGIAYVPGTYVVRIVADDGLDRVQSTPVALTIAAPPPPPAPRGHRSGWVWWAVAALTGALAASGLALRARATRARYPKVNV